MPKCSDDIAKILKADVRTAMILKPNQYSQSIRLAKGSNSSSDYTTQTNGDTDKSDN